MNKTAANPLLQISTIGCDALAELEPHALGLTSWFDALPAGPPYPVTVRFVGRRLGLDARPGPLDTFSASETIASVMPGSGRVAITTKIPDVSPGPWTVTATVTAAPHRHTTSAHGTTGYGPVVALRCPGVRIGAWPAFVGIGMAVALTVQSWLARRAQLPVGTTVTVSLIASLFGLLGAKVYSAAEQRPGPRPPRTILNAGMCIQGFVLAAIPTAAAGTLTAGIPVGRFLDATAPALLFAMAIGRLGCFLGGCCAGRPTASRWGVWSSDRRVGTRRIPTQLLEGALALTLGATALLIDLHARASLHGVTFVGVIAAYTLGRQILLPLRDLPRKTANTRIPIAAAAAALILADALIGTLTTAWR